MMKILIFAVLVLSGCAVPHDTTPATGARAEQAGPAQHEFYTLFPAAPLLPQVSGVTYQRWKDAGDIQSEEIRGSNLYFTVNAWRDDPELGRIANVKRCMTTKPEPIQ